MLVGLMVGRSFELIVAIISILKAGGAYVPIDPDYPEERVRFIAEDAGLRVLVTHSRLARADVCTNVCLDDAGGGVEGASRVLERHVRPTDLVYMMYTSGSTGRTVAASGLSSGQRSRP